MPLVKEVVAQLQALNKPDAPCHIEHDRWISDDIRIEMHLVGDIPHIYLMPVDEYAGSVGKSE